MSSFYKSFLKKYLKGMRNWNPLVPALALTLVACSTTKEVKRSDSAQPTDAVNQAGVNVEASYYTELVFKTGQRKLTESDRAQIDDLVRRANTSGEIKDIKILSWADQDYPSVKRGKLSKKQRDLADERNKNITKYLKRSQIHSSSVDSYNMAERPNTLQQWFDTSDQKLKGGLAAAGLPTTASDQQNPSKASHSVILTILK